MDWWRIASPLSGAHNAPTRDSPTAITRQRARARPDLPQPGENFTAYQARTGGAPLAGEAQAQRGMSGQPRFVGRSYRGRFSMREDTAAEAAQRQRERRAAGPADPRHVIGDGMVEAYNRPTMRAFDIPLGTTENYPPAINPQGRPLARGYDLGPDGYPTGGLTLGLYTWGTDGRREFGSIITDVENMSGAPEGLLNAIGHRESVGDPLRRRQRNPHSSASGPFQFTEDTWRLMLGLGGESYGVPVTMSRDEKDWLVDDPRISGAMAAELARSNYNDIRRATGGTRDVTYGDLYMVHFSAQSVSLLQDRARGAPRFATAAEYYKDNEVSSNQREFFDNGRPRTPEEFYRFMTTEHMDRPERVATFRPRADGTNDDLRDRQTPRGRAAAVNRRRVNDLITAP